MPVSLIPFINVAVSLLLFVSGGIFLAKYQEKKLVGRSLLLAGGIVLFGPPVGLGFITTGLWAMAASGNNEAQFQYARWLESVPHISHNMTLFPCGYDFDASWFWLCRAAEGGHPEALYARGVRLKYDDFVPAAEDRQDGGKKDINAAIQSGFVPEEDDQYYYWERFRISPEW